jgi:putative flippase GtrA
MRQISAFGVIGAVATVSHYTTLVVLVESGLLGAVAASSLGYLVGGAVNYLLNKRITFRSVVPGRRAVPRFAIVAGIGWLANGTIVWLLTAHLALAYLAAQIVATVVVFAWNFVANKHWTFAQRHPPWNLSVDATERDHPHPS